MLVFKQIIDIIKKIYGEENISVKKNLGNGFAVVYYKGDTLLYLVKSYCKGWVCLFNYNPRYTELSPYLITNNFDAFESYLCYVNKLFKNSLLDSLCHSA